MINNVVLVSGVQQSDSLIHIHVSILFQILFPFRLLHNIEQSSLCYTVDPCWLFILNMAVSTWQSREHCFNSLFCTNVRGQKQAHLYPSASRMLTCTPSDC